MYTLIIKEFFINNIGKIITVIAILFCTFLAAKIVKKLLTYFFEKSAKLIRVEPTHYTFLKHITSAIIYIIGVSLAIYTLPSLRSLSVSLFVGAGILVVIVGFASQQAFANIISGIFIVIFKPFRVGDRITIGTDIAGIVEDITLRHTIIKDWKNKRVIVPNSIISNEKIENADIGDSKICKWVEFGISYDSDINKAMKIMQGEAIKHPNFLDNRTAEEKKNNGPPVKVKVINLGDFSVNLRAWVWARNPGDAFALGCDLNKSIKERFDKEGIEIPFPYRTIVYKRDIKSKRRKRK